MKGLVLFTLVTFFTPSCVHRSADDAISENLKIINGDYIYVNKRSGRVVAESIYENLFQEDQNRPRVLLFTEFDKPIDNFNGIYIFLDAEARGGNYLINRPYKDKTLYLGHEFQSSPTKEKLWLPYAMTSFSERSVNTPDELMHAQQIPQKKYFAAYMAKNCVAKREKLYDQLVDFAEKHNMGEVHALGQCFGSHPETKRPAQGDRGHAGFNDTAVASYKPYKFVLCSENEIAPGYVTEKIVNVFLANAIPIYSGDSSVKELFKSDKFIYLNSYPSLSDALKPFVKHSELAYKMMGAPYLTDKGVHFMTWVKNLRKEEESKHKGSIKDDIYRILKRMDDQNKN